MSTNLPCLTGRVCEAARGAARSGTRVDRSGMELVRSNSRRLPEGCSPWDHRSGYARCSMRLHDHYGISRSVSVALFVGIMVGGAMMHATDGTGGRRYQIAAAVLTYFAVSLAAVPEILYQSIRAGQISRHQLACFPLLAHTACSLFSRSQHFVSGAIAYSSLSSGFRPHEGDCGEAANR